MKRLITFVALALIISAHLWADATMPLNFTAVDGSATVSLTAIGTAPTVNLQYSVDNCSTWNTYTIGSAINLANGAKVYFKALNTNGAFCTDLYNYNNFTMTGNVSADGNIMSLLDATSNQTSVPNYAFGYLFSNCTSLIKAPELPAMNLATRCYQKLFSGCTRLAQAPALPAMTMAYLCYYAMFEDCDALTKAPALPSTNLASSCYSNMFYGCDNLTEAPALPADTLAESCYDCMFSYCSRLKQPPVLHATTLASSCYYAMFYKCTSLAVNTQAPGMKWSIPSNAQGYGASSFQNMFSNTAGPMVSDPTVGTTYYVTSASRRVTANSNDASMGSVTGGGTHYYGDTITLTAVPASGHHFVSWNNDSTSTTLTFVLTQDTTFTATFDVNDTRHLNFTAVDGPATIALVKNGNIADVYLQYSLDSCTTWNTYTIGDAISLASGATVFFKAHGTNSTFGASTGFYYTFNMSGTISADGNIMSLLDETLNQASVPEYAFSRLFFGCSSLTKAPALPATVLSNNCYSYMFEGCSALTQTPELPADTMATYCYLNMFKGCTSLIQAPELPATILADCCYSDMFEGCTSLTEAPTLPADSLAVNCYSRMFKDCIALQLAPELIGSSLAEKCYYFMFDGCTSLTMVSSLPATIAKKECYRGMFKGCTSLTDAPELSATTLAESCYLEMFEGCTKLTQAPSLPADTLAYDCYSYMFTGCISLTEAPALPATSLASECYSYMFDGCTSLTEAPALPATSLDEMCYYEMFTGCTSLTEAPALPATSLASECYSGMFNGCTSLTEAPALPALSLVPSCYVNMFAGCTSLTEAPALPATKLQSACYGIMFSGCTSLTEAPALPADTLAPYCYFNMFNGCTSLTHIHPLPVASLSDNCCTSMYSGCTSLVVNTQAPGMPWSIPANVLNYDESSLTDMFSGTAGTMNSTPLPGTTYYVASATSQVTVNTNDSTMGIVTGGGTHYYNDTITLTAIPAAGHHFVSWSNDSTTNPLTFILTQDTTFTATFDVNDTRHLNFTAVDGPATIALVKNGNLSDVYLQYSLDSCSTWNTYTVGDTLSIANGATLFLKALEKNGAFSDGISYHNFTMTGTVSADGDIMSLLDPTLNQTSVPQYAFSHLFENCTSLTEAPALPATSLADNCYQAMFRKCSSLTEAPALPADTLKLYCYNSMFDSCVSLTQPPLLPATVLADYCYSGMFQKCKSLSQAPALPATKIKNYCYSHMFEACKSLILPPALPADTLAGSCYDGMFSSCSSLSQAPVLPATTLANNCYQNMFSYCTSLTQPPLLPATSLTMVCYAAMFSGCSSLTQAPELPADTMNFGCYSNMFSGCTSLTQPPLLPALLLNTVCYKGMFDGCTSLSQAPALPATKLVESCYANMFEGCTSLTHAPELPADSLPFRAYYQMFSGCTTLTHIHTLPTITFLGDFCCDEMYSGCTSLTVNTQVPGTPWSIPYSGISEPTIENTFTGTSGTMNGTPSVNTTYYVASMAHQVTVNTNDTTMGSVSGGGTHYYNDTITLTAIPAAGHHFVSWNNDSTSTTLSFILTKDTSFTATFAINQHTVTVNTNDPAMGTVTGSGTYNYGDTVTLTAIPAANHHFVSWSNDSTSTTLSFILTKDTTFTATFAINQHTVTVNANDPAMGSVTGSGTYNYGDTVTLTATPAANHHFVSWSNDSISTTLRIVLTQDTSFTATFAIDQHTVTVNTNDPAMGSVTGSGTYNYGDTVTLTAIPAANHHFVSWSNDSISTTLRIVLTQDTSFTATFAIDQHTVTVNTNDPTMGSVTGGGTYNYGNNVTLTATPATGHHFVSWSNGSTSPTLVFAITQDTSFTATFALSQHTVTVNTNDPTMGSVSGSSGTYNYGDTITLTATPADNHHFVSWSNGAKTPTISFALTQDTTLTATFEADAFNGTIGDNLHWTISQRSGELSFSGSGSTPDYSATDHAPWYYNRSYVTHVTMPAGVISRLGDFAFDDFTNLYYAELNTNTLGASVFNDCSSLTLCHSETNAVANANTMDGCTSSPLLIVHDYEWYRHTYTDSLALSINIYPYLTDYTEDTVLTLNATVTLHPSLTGISVSATRHQVNGTPLHLPDNCNIIWKDSLVAPLVYEFLSQGAGYLGKNSFLGCTSLHRIIVSPKYWGTNGTTSNYAYAHLDSIHADAFDSIYPDIVDLYEETLYQPGKVENYSARKNNLGQTLLYVPDTLAATGKTMWAQYSATPFWKDNFAEINNKNIVDTQYVDTASAHVAFYYQDVIDSMPVESYRFILYKIGGTDTADVYFSNDTTFEINRKPRIIVIMDSVTGTTTTVTISIDHSAYNPNIQEVNVHMQHMAENCSYSMTLMPLNELGQILAIDSCTLTTTIVLSDPTITENDDADLRFFPTENTDVFLIDGKYIGKYHASLPPGIYLMRENNRWHKFAKSR